MGAVPLVAAAVCPHPPLIVPEVAQRAAPELDALRAAADAAVVRLLAAEPDTVLIVGAAPRTHRFAPDDAGDLRAYGVAVEAGLGAATRGGPHVLPLSLTIGAWLLARTGTGVPRFAQGVAADASPPECARLGARLAAEFTAEPARRVALLVTGDGSACRGERSPGHDDPRAEAYDRHVAAALAAADTRALLDLDPALSAALRAAGRPPWQVLAAAVEAAGGDWRGELSYDAAPYGVAYFVANWEPRR
ncbi:hypothetical protein ACK8GG_10750 [Micromonosporaceae bacterium DT55]|uniref:hypothetical protein n=1 Tax=Melissospora conviva TaxID=3388432 RepID=UPI003C26DBEA